jgi:hypothetical protein
MRCATLVNEFIVRENGAELEIDTRSEFGNERFPVGKILLGKGGSGSCFDVELWRKRRCVRCAAAHHDLDEFEGKGWKWGKERPIRSCRGGRVGAYAVRRMVD